VSDHSELKRLADTLLAIGHREDFGVWITALEAFEKASGPEAVLALLAENEALRGLYRMHKMTETREMRDVKAERDQLRAQVNTAECRLEVSEDTLQTIRGCLRSAEGDIDQLRAEVKTLREKARLSDRIIEERNRLLGMFECPAHGLCVPYAIEEVVKLRADGKRYRWLSAQADLAWQISDLESAIDAAMSKEAG
jgi:hypothetical protein